LIEIRKLGAVSFSKIRPYCQRRTYKTGALDQIRDSAAAFATFSLSVTLLFGRGIGVGMFEFIRVCASFLAAAFKSRAGLQAENLALRHQLSAEHQKAEGEDG
jgi:hypothetical protein